MRLGAASCDELAALSVRKAELRRAMRLVTAAWVLGIVWRTCTHGSWMNSFGRMLGFSNFHFGLWTAMPHLAALANLAAVVLLDRTGRTKHLFLVTLTASRVLWLVVALVFITAGGTVLGIWLVLLTALASWVLGAMGAVAFQTWMGDMIPRRIRGRYWAARSRITRALIVPVAIGLAIFMDHMTDPARPMTMAAQPALMWSLAGVLVIAAVFGVADILMFIRIREVRPTVPDRHPPPAVDFSAVSPGRGGAVGALLGAPRYLGSVVKQLLADPLKDPAFRRYVLYGATVTFAIGAGGPFFIRNMREALGLSHMGISVIWMILGPLMAILAARPWGRLVDRWGRRPMLMAATTVACFGALPYIFASRATPNPPYVSEAVNATAGFMGWLGAAAASLLGWAVDWGSWQPLAPGAPVGAWMICASTMFFGFVGWSGVMIGQQGIILGFADGQGRSKYVAAHAVFCGLGGFIGANVGGFLADSLAFISWQHPIRVGPFEWNNWHATFLLSTAARVAALLLLIKMPDPGARRARDMVRTVGGEMLQLLTGRWLSGWLGGGRSRRTRRDDKR